ncbi:hypothetical protein [Cryptosporangium aurantiacum]|uniref:SCO6045-like C-terminal domain-containing protein n=1 Tax=Cryptosporangium aurantiacum TaxID=134849 RepID=A0A1M7HTR1_9ACTN|nr:hypothetical protein [Cryptosporangium aurantiacum]SHM31874.1 hypothetical protein SAMN05443668_101289 [Cryptosporangium aurantiacum]
MNEPAAGAEGGNAGAGAPGRRAGAASAGAASAGAASAGAASAGAASAGAASAGAAARAGGAAELAAAQAALVAALVGGGELPPGFDADRVGAARRALLRKRAGEVARAWPLLAASLGAAFTPRFVQWAAGRPPSGSFADGLAFAHSLRDAGELPPLAAEELAQRAPRPAKPRRRFWRRGT